MGSQAILFTFRILSAPFMKLVGHKRRIFMCGVGHLKTQYPKTTARLAWIQSTTRITEFFVVGKMSGILVRFVILVGAPIETRRLWYVLCSTYRQRVFCLNNKSNYSKAVRFHLIIGYWKRAPFHFKAIEVIILTAIIARVSFRFLWLHL